MGGNAKRKSKKDETYRRFVKKIHICDTLPVENVIMRESMKR